MKLILLGAAGSGKGTIAKKIMQDYGIPQISTGDILRDIAKSGTALGEKVGSFQKQGILVPDEITFEVLKNRLKQSDCKKGFILDGYPRTLSQAKLLDTFTKVDAVLKVDLPFEELERRLVSRRQCAKCGDIDNINYPGYTGKCRKCGEKLFQRNDDKPEAIKVRLEAYKNNITPLVGFYGDKVVTVSNDGTPDETYALVKTYLSRIGAKKKS